MNAMRDAMNKKNAEKCEKRAIEKKTGNGEETLPDFDAFKRSKQYDVVKRLMGLTDTKIELAYELAKRGKRLPPPRAVRVVRCLDNAFLAILLGAFLYVQRIAHVLSLNVRSKRDDVNSHRFVMYHQYGDEVRSTWYRLFPQESMIVSQARKRVGSLFHAVFGDGHGIEREL